jgi:hypothetical protein
MPSHRRSPLHAAPNQHDSWSHPNRSKKRPSIDALAWSGDHATTESYGPIRTRLRLAPQWLKKETFGRLSGGATPFGLRPPEPNACYGMVSRPCHRHDRRSPLRTAPNQHDSWSHPNRSKGRPSVGRCGMVGRPMPQRDGCRLNHCQGIRCNQPVGGLRSSREFVSCRHLSGNEIDQFTFTTLRTLRISEEDALHMCVVAFGLAMQVWASSITA